MAHYRFYCLDHNARIRGAVDAECRDDTDAVAQARTGLDGRAIEIWQGVRPVGRVDPDGSCTTLGSAPIQSARLPL